MQDSHQNLASFGSGIGLRTKADFPGDNQRTQFPLSQVIIRRNITIFRPVIKSVCLFTKYILDFLNGRVSGLPVNNTDDYVFNPGRMACFPDEPESKASNVGFGRIVFVATSPAAVSAYQKAIGTVKYSDSDSIELLTWLDIS